LLNNNATQGSFGRPEPGHQMANTRCLIKEMTDWTSIPTDFSLSGPPLVTATSASLTLVKFIGLIIKRKNFEEMVQLFEKELAS
jgi:hypothetical protein